MLKIPKNRTFEKKLILEKPVIQKKFPKNFDKKKTKKHSKIQKKIKILKNSKKRLYFEKKNLRIKVHASKKLVTRFSPKLSSSLPVPFHSALVILSIPKSLSAQTAKPSSSILHSH